MASLIALETFKVSNSEVDVDKGMFITFQEAKSLGVQVQSTEPSLQEDHCDHNLVNSELRPPANNEHQECLSSSKQQGYY